MYHLLLRNPVQGVTAVRQCLQLCGIVTKNNHKPGLYIITRCRSLYAGVRQCLQSCVALLLKNDHKPGLYIITRCRSLYAGVKLGPKAAWFWMHSALQLLGTVCFVAGIAIALTKFRSNCEWDCSQLVLSGRSGSANRQRFLVYILQ